MFKSTSANSKTTKPTAACLIVTKIEKCKGIVFGAFEHQLQDGGFSVIAHLLIVNKFIELRIRNGISTT